MKKLVVLGMTIMLLFSAGYGQTKKTDKKEVKETRKELKSNRIALKKLEGTMVSDRAKESFGVDFGTAGNVTWKRDGAFDVATFTKGGKEMKAYYDESAVLVGTTNSVAFSALPEKGQAEVKKIYKGYSIGPCVFFDDNEKNDTDMILYGVQFDDADNYLVELTKGANHIVVMVSPEGNVSFFAEVK